MSSDPSWFLLGLIAAVTVLLVALTAYLARTEADAVEAKGLARLLPRRNGADPKPDPLTVDAKPADAKQRAAIIINPTKFADVAEVRAMIRRMCATEGWADPWWAETTVEETGSMQARQAIEAGVDVVCPLGGDGTVRNVASALVDTGMPIGLLPGGTGNLLARNLELPVDSLRRSMKVVLTGRNAPIDTCSLRLTRPSAEQLQARREDPDDKARNVDLDDAATPVDSSDGNHETDTHGSDTSESDTDGAGQIEEHMFLVMAGLGFDAEVMATAPEDLKATIGWGAYVFAGAQHLQGPQFHVDVMAADGHSEHRRVRSVILGNVGKLQGGFELLPESRSDDGLITALLLYPRGLLGWASIWRKLVFKGDIGPPARLTHLSSTRIRVEASKPVEIQIDGDVLGAGVVLDVEVRPKSLVVRLPAKHGQAA
ncbi:MAG: diacylglycerol kinase family protein [Ornithinimicrobium sp.]